MTQQIVRPRGPIGADDDPAPAEANGAVPTTPPPPTPRTLSQRIAPLALPMFFLALMALFSALRPDTFATGADFKAILITQAVLAVVSIAAVLPLAIGQFDLSVGANLGVGLILTTGLTANQHLPLSVAIVLSLIACTLIGIVNGLLVAKVGLNAFIATLAMGTILAGAVTWYTNSTIIANGVPQTLTSWSQQSALGIPLPAVAMVLVALAAWYLLEQTPFGRYMRATGGSSDAARLTGINVVRVTVTSFALTGLACGIAGVMEASVVGSGNPASGADFLLPAFAAAFLGAAGIQIGRFNVWGTLIAVFTIAVGVTGLQDLGVAFYIQPIFNGAVLLVGVMLSRMLSRR